MENADGIVSWIQRQYFQTVPMKYFDWESLKNTKTIEQEIILKATCLNPLSKKYPPSNSYKLAFLKTLLSIYEEQDCEISDEIYSCITDIVAKKHSQEDSFNYKSYVLPCGRAITLCESSQFISQGTTGLNSWEAGKFLCNWIIQNKEVVCGKNVLELGCGVGLSGIVALHCCRPKTYFFTDCHEKVLQKVQENLEINGFVQALDKEIKNYFGECDLQVLNTPQGHGCRTSELDSRKCIGNQESLCKCTEEEIQDIQTTRCLLYFDECFSRESFRHFPSFGYAKDNCETCSFHKENLEKYPTHAVACHLDWQGWSHEQAKQYSPDVILAADVIFDPHVINTLVSVIKSILQPKTVAYIASTVRNKETYEKFLHSLDSSGLKKSVITDVPEKLFFYNTASEILLLKLQL